MTDPNGPAFEAAMAALRSGFDQDPVAIGCGGSIGFVGPLAELFGGAPALLLGIEDPASNAHAPNESLHEGDWKKLMASLVAPVRRPREAAGREGEVKRKCDAREDSASDIHRPLRQGGVLVRVVHEARPPCLQKVTHHLPATGRPPLEQVAHETGVGDLFGPAAPVAMQELATTRGV